MIELLPFAGIPVAVMGLGKSGVASAKALIASGAEVWAWDDSQERRAEAEAERIPIVDLYAQDLAAARTIVWSPGIPHRYPKPHPIAERARRAGLEIVSDVELLARSERASSYIGVTGTNGKSTTTALVGHILGRAGRKVAAGGNLGTPALALEPLGKDGTYVLEMSSYQLELTPSLAFDVGVLTNISPDHLERHGGLAGYIEAKKRIFQHQGAAATAVVGVDDPPSRAICEELAAKGEQRVVPVSAETSVERGVYVRDGKLVDDSEGKCDEVADLAAIPALPGRHNWHNAAAAYAATRAMGVPPVGIAKSFGSFPGLAHRQELVAVIDGVRFVNDSKATNADAAAKALVCYERIYWLAGGRAKAGGIEPLAPYFGRIAHAYLIGEAADGFAKTLAGKVPTTLARTLDAALAAASRDAREAGKGAVVLLSPACASWDQFSSFEARGDAFKALVARLPGRRELARQREGAA